MTVQPEKIAILQKEQLLIHKHLYNTSPPHNPTPPSMHNKNLNTHQNNPKTQLKN